MLCTPESLNCLWKNEIVSSCLDPEEPARPRLSNRTCRAKVEVDFVLYGEHGLHAFEIKHSTQVNSKSLKGLKQFLEDYPEAKATFVYLGKSREYHGKIEAIPMSELLAELPQFLSSL